MKIWLNFFKHQNGTFYRLSCNSHPELKTLDMSRTFTTRRKTTRNEQINKKQYIKMLKKFTMYNVKKCLKKVYYIKRFTMYSIKNVKKVYYIKKFTMYSIKNVKKVYKSFKCIFLWFTRIYRPDQ